MRSSLVVSAACSLCLAVIAQGPVLADVQAILLAEQRALNRIALAARQRYMVEKVGKSACFALSEHDPQSNALAASQHLDAFETSFEILIDGDPAADLAPEQDTSVLALISDVGIHWPTFSAATRQIVSGDWHSVPMAQILSLHPEVATQVNETVDAIIEEHVADLATQKAYAETVNVAGRQRMLVQKAAKEMCFVSLGIDAENMRTGLATSLELFETSLFALENGDFDKSIIDPPSLAVLVKIAEVRDLWTTYRAALEPAVEGETPSFEDVAYVEQTSGPLYELSHALVELYVKK